MDTKTGLTLLALYKQLGAKLAKDRTALGGDDDLDVRTQWLPARARMYGVG